MVAYWVLFFATAMAALQSNPYPVLSSDGSRWVRLGPTWLFVYLILVSFIGLRLEVGGDWFTYLGYVDQARRLDLTDLSEVADPGYVALNMISVALGGGITGVNFMGAALFGAGLLVFLRTLPRPWLGLAVAIPYLVIVVAMGYTRQGIALGMVMVGLAALRRERYARFAVWVVIGALFHKSAVLVIPIAILTSSRNRIRTIGLIGVISYAAYDALLARHTEQILSVYIRNELTNSEGAFIRLTMNAVPAVIFLLYGKGFIITEREYRLWRVMSIITLFMFSAFFVFGFSTAIDRMALYLIPLQMVVFCHLPDAIPHRDQKKSDIVMMILGYYALVLFIWLNFAKHAKYWLPYRMGLSLN